MPCLQAQILSDIERMGKVAGGAPPNAAVGQPSLSFDGRIVIFSSRASDLLPMPLVGPANYAQWYLYDRNTRQLERVSVNSQGEPQTGPTIGQQTFTIDVALRQQRAANYRSRKPDALKSLASYL